MVDSASFAEQHSESERAVQVSSFLFPTGTNSEANTPSPCDTVDKQIIVEEAVIEIDTSSSNVETEHMEKVEVLSPRSILSLKRAASEAEAAESASVKEMEQDSNNVIDASIEEQSVPKVEVGTVNSAPLPAAEDGQTDQGEEAEATEETPPEEIKSATQLENGQTEVEGQEGGDETCGGSQQQSGANEETESVVEKGNDVNAADSRSNGDNDEASHAKGETENTVMNNTDTKEVLTNGVAGDGQTESDLSNGEHKKTSDVDKNKSMSWSDAIELGENNNTDKSKEDALEAWSRAEPFIPESDCESTCATIGSSSSASTISQVSNSSNNNSKHESSKPSSSKPTGIIAPSKPQRLETKKSRTQQQGGKGKGDPRDRELGSQRKRGRHWEKTAVNGAGAGEWNANGDAADWGNQAEALPNGNHSDSHSEVTTFAGTVPGTTGANAGGS